jgi:hypothetical protein
LIALIIALECLIHQDSLIAALHFTLLGLALTVAPISAHIPGLAVVAQGLMQDLDQLLSKRRVLNRGDQFSAVAEVADSPVRAANARLGLAVVAKAKDDDMPLAVLCLVRDLSFDQPGKGVPHVAWGDQHLGVGLVASIAGQVMEQVEQIVA